MWTSTSESRDSCFRPKLGHDLREIHSTQYGEKHLTQTPTNLKLKHTLKLDVHTVSHVEFVVFAERIDEPQMRRRVGQAVGVLLVDPRRFGGLLALFLGRELVVE